MQSAQPRVTVVVPVYNGDKTISRCLDSLLEQKSHAGTFGVMVVDNGSTDHTLKILKSYRNKISIINESSRGPAAARNRGIISSSSDIVAFIDADCVVESDWLEKLVLQFDAPDTRIVVGKIRSISEHNPIQLFGEKIHDHQAAVERCSPPYFIGMNLAIKRDILETMNLFDTNLLRGEDVDLAWRLADAGYTFRYSGEVVIYHHNESTLAGLFREGFQHGFYAVQLLRKHEVFLEKNSGKRDVTIRFQRAVSSFKKWLGGSGSGLEIRYDCIFNTGKLVGSALGSIRFRYLQL